MIASLILHFPARWSPRSHLNQVTILIIFLLIILVAAYLLKCKRKPVSLIITRSMVSPGACADRACRLDCPRVRICNDLMYTRTAFELWLA